MGDNGLVRKGKKKKKNSIVTTNLPITFNQAREKVI